MKEHLPGLLVLTVTWPVPFRVFCAVGLDVEATGDSTVHCSIICPIICCEGIKSLHAHDMGAL